LQVRDKIRQLAQAWSNPYPEHILGSFHDYWNLWAQMLGLSITGYNLFIRKYFPFDLDEAAILYVAGAREGDDTCTGDQTGIWGWCNQRNALLNFFNEDTGVDVDITVNETFDFSQCVSASDFPAHSWVRVTCRSHPMPEIRFRVFDYDFGWA